MDKRTVIIDGVKKTFHEAHQNLWNELSQYPGMTKFDYFRIHKVLIGGKKEWVLNNCFACESCDNDCKKCPVILWRNDAKAEPNSDIPCAWEIEDGDEKDGLFDAWINAMYSGNYNEACEIAKQIADLEWEEVET